jgi:uncharacterized protein
MLDLHNPPGAHEGGTMDDGSASGLVPPLLRRVSNDEVDPLPHSATDRTVLARLADELPARARRVGLRTRASTGDRRTTAATLRAIDHAHGGGFYPLAEDTTLDLDAADAAFTGGSPVIDVQTHLVDPVRFSGAREEALTGFLRMVDPQRWPGPIDGHVIDAAAWAALVFGTSETAIALLTSTPGPADDNVLTNRQIAAARDLVDRYAGSGRVLTHTIVHPNLGRHELDAMEDLQRDLRPSAWKVYTLFGPPTPHSPDGGWFLDDDVGLEFLARVDAVGPRIVCAHKGLGGPIPAASVRAASPRDIGPAAAAFPGIDFVVYHSGYERDPDSQEGAYDRAAPAEELSGVDRLVRSVVDAGLGPGGNVHAELGSTWFLMLRRPREAAHVLGKLLVALGPENILWGTDSIWYGSPQPLIDAFRAFQIPPAMQEEFGYPALTAEVKRQILGGNAQALYGITGEHLERATHDRDRSWPADAADDLRRAVAAAT